MSHEFKIGTSAGSLTLLSELPTPIYEPEWERTPYSDEHDLSNGMVLGAGWIEATWHWGFLTYDMYDQLKVFCPGKSSNVWIRTKKTTNQYTTYSAVMVMPKDENQEWHNDRVLDFEVKFQKMVGSS